MKSTKRFLVFLVVAAMCLTAFSACGQKGADSSEGSPSAQAPATQTGSAAPAEEEVKKPEKITMISSGASLVEPEKNAAFEKAVSDAIGIEFKNIYDTKVFDRVTLMAAGGEKIDVVLSNTTGFFKTTKVSQEILPEWIEDTTYIKQIPEEFWTVQRREGKTWGVPYRYYSAWVTWVRQDWLDALGLSVPATVDDYVNVARAFTKNDPDKNNKNDTYGFSASNQWDALNQFFWPFHNAFVKYPMEFAYDTDLNKYFSVWLTPEYKEYMRWLAGVYAEGLIDPEDPTNQHTNYYDKFYAGKVGFLTGFAHEASVHVDKLKAVDPNAKMVPIAPPKGIAGNGYTAALSDIGFAIMQSCDNPQGVLKYFIDWAHSNEGYNMFCWGPEGMNWKKENGVAVKTASDPSCGLSPQHVILKDTFESWVPTRQEDQEAFDVNAANIRWKMQPYTLPDCPDNRSIDFNMKSLELWTKMLMGDVDVDKGFEQMQAAYKDTKMDEWMDQLNADLSWAKEK